LKQLKILKFKEMKKYFLFIGLFTCTLGMAQEGENMVENGSFENFDKTPKKLGGMTNATGWESATGQKADLFVSDRKVPEIDPSKNIYGGETPQDGNAFAGVLVYSKGNKMPRTYITSKMNETMKKGQTYCVKFYVSLADNSKFAIDNIAAHFSKKDISITDKKTILDKPHVRETNNKIISAMYGWERVCGTYTAQGGEKFITIGNFNTSEETKEDKIRPDKNNKAPQIMAAYYFVDNVSVQLLEEDERCDCGSDEYEEVGSSLIYSSQSFIKDNMSLEDKLTASTIYFAFGRDLINGSSINTLDKIAEWLKANPNAKVRVVAHIDTEEAKIAEENSVYKGVAIRRANGAIKYLIDQGIDETRLIFTDKGDRAPAASDGDDEELNQAKNRRVEFVLEK
jgi:outer membrane protein OmpA-like peptidoglycan-associated protein